MRKQTQFINEELLKVGDKSGNVRVPKTNVGHPVLLHSPASPVEIDKEVLNRSALIIINEASTASLEVADYYVNQRGPESNIENKFSEISTLFVDFGEPTYDANGALIQECPQGPLPSVLDDLLANPLISYITEMEEIPGYIILSKDCPFYHANNSGGHPYGDTPSTIESYLYRRIRSALSVMVSVTRLEGRTVQDVKDIIDRSVLSDTYDMSNMTCCINDVGYHQEASRIDRAVISARSLPEIANRAIVRGMFDNPRIEDIPITQNTGFYIDLSGIYLYKSRGRDWGENQTPNYVYYPMDFITGLTPELVDGKWVDTIPEPYSVQIDWTSNNAYIRYHDGDWIGEVTIDSIPEHWGDLFSVSSVPVADYGIGDDVWLHKVMPLPYWACELKGKVTAYDAETSTLTMSCTWRHDAENDNYQMVEVGAPMSMACGRRLEAGIDIDFSEDYSVAQQVIWLTERPTCPFWYPVCEAVSVALSRYEQIQYLPGAYTMQMNSACGAPNALVNRTKYTRDTTYAFYSQMNRPNGATLGIGSPFEPYADGLGDSNYIMLMLSAGYNFGLSTIYGVLQANVFGVGEDQHTSIVGDPLCAPHARSPLITFGDILRVYWNNGWVGGRHFEEAGLSNSSFNL